MTDLLVHECAGENDTEPLDDGSQRLTKSPMSPLNAT